MKTTAIEHAPVTIERLERAVAFCAVLVALDGPVLAPLLEKLERELSALRASASDGC
jgi:hypothetical protein